MPQQRESLYPLPVDRDAGMMTLPLSPASTTLPGGMRRTFYYGCKRAMDVIVALTLLVLLSPLLLLIALLIKLDSPGPVLFVQYRVGSRRRRRGRETNWEVCLFPFYKFRTMFTNTDDSLHREYIREFCQERAATDRAPETRFKLKDDPRVTRLGRVLRKTSLDELPQLFNILKGNMSIVGNSPLPLYEAELLTRDVWAKRFLAPAGLTGLWQVTKRGKNSMSTEERIHLDVTYADNHSFWYDMKIIAKTPFALIQEENV